jgi:hypothetical protein
MSTTHFLPIGLRKPRACEHHSLGLAAHLGWARLLVDCYRDLVELPAPTREDPGDRHYFIPGGEGAFEYENYHSPDTR